MADDKDPHGQRNNLALLKGQLQDIRQQVENKMQVGVQDGSVLSLTFLKGCLAGYIVAKLRSSAYVGVLVGTCTGIFAAQNYKVPNIEQTIKGYFSSSKK